VRVLEYRTYGASGPVVIAVHGGPGAAGSMGIVAKEISREFRVLEPFQRKAGAERLTVALHVRDMHDFIQAHCAGERPLLVGHSWGAMLSLAYASEHPDAPLAIVLICCNTLNEETREKMNAIIASRTVGDLKTQFQQTERETDPNKRMALMGKFMLKVQSYDLIPREAKGESKREAAISGFQREAWEDMLRLQNSGAYPAAFARIKVPVIMLHGSYDPHPGDLIYHGLKRYMPHLEYREWERCGHYPWLERHAKDDFFAALKEWLKRQGDGRPRILRNGV
jgi:pimeloyl-ACP methyl ester carboxylesterase